MLLIAIQNDVFERKIIHMNIGWGPPSYRNTPGPLGVVAPSHWFVPPLLPMLRYENLTFFLKSCYLQSSNLPLQNPEIIIDDLTICQRQQVL